MLSIVLTEGMMMAGRRIGRIIAGMMMMVLTPRNSGMMMMVTPRNNSIIIITPRNRTGMMMMLITRNSRMMVMFSSRNNRRSLTIGLGEELLVEVGELDGLARVVRSAEVAHRHQVHARDVPAKQLFYVNF